MRFDVDDESAFEITVHARNVRHFDEPVVVDEPRRQVEEDDDVVARAERPDLGFAHVPRSVQRLLRAVANRRSSSADDGDEASTAAASHINDNDDDDDAPNKIIAMRRAVDGVGDEALVESRRGVASWMPVATKANLSTALRRLVDEFQLRHE